MKLILTIWLYSLINFCFYSESNELIVDKLITATFLQNEICNNVYESITFTTTQGCFSTLNDDKGYYIIVTTDNYTSYYLVIPPGYEYYDINLDCYK